jgi:hypothetical protein
MQTVPPRANRVPLPISLTYRRAGDDHWMQSRVANLSESGVLFGPTNLQPGAKVELIIASPIAVGSLTAGKVVCVANVVRTNEVGATGARFEGCRFLVER